MDTLGWPDVLSALHVAKRTAPFTQPSATRGGVDHVGPGEVVVVVRGGLNVTTSGTLRAALTALLNSGGLDTIGLDLRQVDLLDPAAVGTLVAAQRICHEMGVQLRVTAVGRGARLLAAATAS